MSAAVPERGRRRRPSIPFACLSSGTARRLSTVEPRPQGARTSKPRPQGARTSKPRPQGARTSKLVRTAPPAIMGGMAIRIGTSGCNYPEWRGTFYPEKFPTGKMLPYYAERFSTVEINYTFYRMPSVKTIAGWDAETPPGFRFTLKAPQRITHFARLRDVADPLRYFCDTARALG